jgi:hypothetical protein
LDGAPYTAAIASESGTSTLTNAAGHTIIGGGQINTPLLNHGTLEIGIPAVLSNLNPVRSMTASAPITMGPNGFLKIGVTGTQQSDTLTSTSTFHANGTLEVSYTNDFVPIGYWNHCIITAEHGVTGEFDAVSLPDNTSDPRLTYKVLYMQNEIRVGVYCTADIDNSGHLNFLDISAFLTAFGNQDPAADFTGEGSFNFLDVSAFLSAFGNGCP